MQITSAHKLRGVVFLCHLRLRAMIARFQNCCYRPVSLVQCGIDVAIRYKRCEVELLRQCHRSRSPLQIVGLRARLIAADGVAVASTYQYEATAPVNYPYISFTLKAWDEYMQNGAVHEKVGVVTDTGGRALLGGYSDLDRLLSSASRDALYFTRKPTSHPELLCDGDTYILPNDMSATIANITAGPRSLPYPVVIDKDHPAGLRTLGGRSVYVMPAQRDRYQFRFINRFGVMESFAAMALRETTVAITKNNYLLANRETFNSFSRRLIKKQNDVETWKMSTGPLDDSWQQWVMHDFLMTEHAWILVSGNWLPCVVSPDDSVSALNRHAHDVMDVQFSVIFDLNGSPSLKS